MNWLRISNDGLICPEDLTLIGSSTKREQSGKIGMFGSGWKYALAWLIRNDCKPFIYSGNAYMNIDFKVKMHRSNIVNVITVNDIETSLTTEMGPKWTGWMALREVISNAIDEGGYSITTQWSPTFAGEQGRTVVYIPMNGELSEVMLKYDSYFAFNRKEIFKNECGRIFQKHESSPLNVYRKGIRCFDTKIETTLDFDFEDISINEDRLAQSYTVQYRVADIIKAGVPVGIFKKILEEEQSGWLPGYMTDKIFDNLKLLCEMGCTFTTGTLQKLGGIFFSKADALVIPAEWYKKLQDLGLVVSPFEILGSGNEQFIRTDAKQVKGIKYYLEGFNIPIEILSGKCDSEVFVSGNTAYVRDDCKMDDRTIAAQIMKRLEVPYLTHLMR